MPTFLIIILAIAAAIFIWSMLMGTTLVIEKRILIRRSSSELFAFLRLLKSQQSFSVWVMQDPKQSTHMTGQDGEIGAIYAWESHTDKQVGAGEQEITALNPNQRIDTVIRFRRPMQSVANTTFLINEQPDGMTEVSWRFSSVSKFPMNLFKPLLTSMLGKSMAQSLQNLKALMEQTTGHRA